jgi:hypothetical protein
MCGGFVPRPKGKSMVDSKLLYKVKHASDGNIEGVAGVGLVSMIPGETCGFFLLIMS